MMIRYLAKLLTIVLLGGSLHADQSYQEQLEAAIVASDSPKVARLLKRRNKISLSNFNRMLGWASDTIEQRRTLPPTLSELLLFFGSAYFAVPSGVAGLMYYFDVGNFKEEVRVGFMGGETGFLSSLGLMGLFTAYTCYKVFSGPRRRLVDSYKILFALEDTVDALESRKRTLQLRARRSSQARS